METILSGTTWLSGSRQLRCSRFDIAGAEITQPTSDVRPRSRSLPVCDAEDVKRSEPSFGPEARPKRLEKVTFQIVKL
jgi:hypothetical protein